MTESLSQAQHQEVYRLMRLCRRVDEEVVNLQRQGMIAAFPPMSGQEAAQVGSAFALEPGDYAFPSYRELGVALARGVDPVAYLLAFRGDWHGGLYDPSAKRFAMIASSVGSQLLHAVGWAMGARKDGRRDCAIVYFGEGATSQGDCHEAMNFAGVFRAPVVFLCQNNQWAISVPVARQTAAPIWKKADAYGFPGVQVDGNDVVAVYEATRAALDRAREAMGPTLIEALTYRVGPHSTADDPSRYRDSSDGAEWRDRDPIDRQRSLILERGLAAPSFFDEVEDSCAKFVARVRTAIAEAPPPLPEDLFEFVFKEPPASLARQRAELTDLVALESEEPPDA